jgi:hypothetical protein
MVVRCRIRILFIAIIHIALVRRTASSDEANSSCPLRYWFNKESGHCECCTTKMYTGVCGCHITYLEILHGHCMTWNNATQDVEVGRCLSIYQDKRHMCDYKSYKYRIPTNIISGPELHVQWLQQRGRRGLL